MNSVYVWNDMGQMRPTPAAAMVEVSVAGTAVALGPTVDGFPNTGTHVLIQVQGGPLRFRADGTDPTTTVGMLVEDGVSVTWTKEMARASVWIRDGTTSGKVLVQSVRVA
jgi:hypothetical protein